MKKINVTIGNTAHAILKKVCKQHKLKQDLIIDTILENLNDLLTNIEVIKQETPNNKLNTIKKDAMFIKKIVVQALMKTQDYPNNYEMQTKIFSAGFECLMNLINENDLFNESLINLQKVLETKK
jgi:hypothetical protein